MRMKILCKHIIDSLLVGVGGGIAFVLFQSFFANWSQLVIEHLAGLGSYGVVALTVAFPLLLAHLWPSFFKASLRSLLSVFRGHVGIWLRVALGLCVAVAVETFILTPTYPYPIDARAGAIVAGGMIAGMLAGGAWAKWMTSQPCERKTLVTTEAVSSDRFEGWLLR